MSSPRDVERHLRILEARYAPTLSRGDSLTLVPLIVAAVSFGAATIGVTSRVNLVALGLLAWVLAVLVPLL